MKWFAFFLHLLIFPCVLTYAQKAPFPTGDDSAADQRAGLGLPPSATLVVTKTADTNDGVCNTDCSLREAVAAAAPGDTITFASPLFDTAQTVQINGQLTINKNLTINGRGANLTTIQNIAGASATSRVLFVTGGTTVSLSGVTVTGGNLTDGGGGFVGCNAACGGGIANQGSLTMNNCVVSGNAANGTGIGGGIANSGTLFLTNSTVANNFAGGSSASGGGIYNLGGTMNVTNSTVRGNSAAGSSAAGGGIYNGNATLNVTNSTLSGNSTFGGTSSQGGGIRNFGTSNITNSTISGNSANATSVVTLNWGGGIFVNGTVRARNTIVSGNSAAADPNLLGSFAVNDANFVDNEANVKLAPLGFYGGTTMTIPLLGGSTAINAGNSCVLNQSCASFNAPVALSSDQRGAARVGNVDIGAFEVNSSANGGTFRATLPNGRLNSPYNFTLVPSNGSTSYAVTGALPPGMNLTTAFAPNAVVSLAGTPTSGGVFNFSITATNGGNTSVTDYSLNIVVPTAAGVSVSGRVTTTDGRGLRNATVTMTDASGVTRSARTGTFGYYRFDDVESGQVMTFGVKAKRANFPPQVVYVGDSIVDLNFVEGGGQ